MELAAQLADPEDQPAYRELLDRTRRIRRFTAARRERMDEILYCVRSAADRATEVIERSISEAARRELILK